MSAREKPWPALALFFLAPAVGELLSGSAPPAEFFNPFTLVLLGVLYGGGAILVRELRLRWGQGWAAVLLLGAAYGLVEEGLMVKSFFDPNWIDIGVLGSYGRWAGVNWIWTMGLTGYHAVFSIAIPIFLVETLFPARRHEPWVGRRGAIVLAVLLAADVALGFFLLTLYRPPLLPYLLTAVAVVVLAWLARRWPRAAAPSAAGRAVPRPRVFAAAGLLATLAWFLVLWVLPHTALPALLALAAGLAIAGLAAWGLGRLSRGWQWAEPHQLALAAGALGFFIVIAPLQELDRTRPDDTAGMALVGLAVLLLLLVLWRGVRRRAKVLPEPALKPI